jgi:hypothetical protein
LHFSAVGKTEALEMTLRISRPEAGFARIPTRIGRLTSLGGS